MGILVCLGFLSGLNFLGIQYPGSQFYLINVQLGCGLLMIDNQICMLCWLSIIIKLDSEWRVTSEVPLLPLISN